MKNRSFKSFCASLSLFETTFKKIGKSCLFLSGYLIVEICFWLVVLGIAYLFVSLGFTDNIALTLAIAILALLIAIPFMVNFLRKSRNSRKFQVKLHNWICQTIVNRESPEWTEYQDWLHDILLARRQLLDAKYPQWKVAIITYWRLSAFIAIVSFSKIKSLAVSVMKLR